MYKTVEENDALIILDFGVNGSKSINTPLKLILKFLFDFVFNKNPLSHTVFTILEPHTRDYNLYNSSPNITNITNITISKHNLL